MAVASTSSVRFALTSPPEALHPPRRRQPELTSRFLFPTRPLSSLKRPPASLSVGSFAAPRSPPRVSPVMASAQSNIFKVIQTAWRIGKDGIEAGTNLVPDMIPKPIARICMVGVVVTVALFLLKSLISTAFFVLAMMGLIYFAFIALNADEATRAESSSQSSEDETLEEARRIMEKYK